MNKLNDKIRQIATDIKDSFSTKETRLLLILLLIAFIGRIVLAPIMHGHPTDITNFKAWSITLTKVGLGRFFNDVWCDYPPAYLYVLWSIGNIYRIFDPNFANWTSIPFTMLIKLPAIIAETINIALIFYIIRKYTNYQLSFLAAIIYACQPAMIFESSFWGQIDSVIFLFQLLSIYCLLKNNSILAIIFTAIGVLIKPQGLILLPLILFIAIRKKQWMNILVGGTISFLIATLFTIPFTKEAPLTWLWEHYIEQAKLYPYSSIQTFNLWSFTGLWKSDARTILGISHGAWGLILFALVYIGILAFVYIKSKDEEGEKLSILHACTLIMIAFFLFPTRMHERYLFSGVSFLAISAALNHKWRIPYLLYSLTFLINDFYELPGTKDGFPLLFQKINAFLASGQMYSESLGLFWYLPITILNLGLFGYLCYLAWKYALMDTKEEQVMEWQNHLLSTKEKLKETKLGTFMPLPAKIDRIDRIFILALMLISTWLKLYRLDFPPEMVFDEVYHARAGGEYVIGIHPFEWVHPPLAKLLITLGVYLYDLTAFGWRTMPLICSALIIPFLYILGKNIFNNRWLALVGAAIFTLDGVYFVQARIAMTNIFAILFQVVSVTIFFMYLQQSIHFPEKKKKYLYLIASCIAIGLALSCRWTSLWAFGFMWLCVLWINLMPRISLQDIMGFIKREEWHIEFKPFRITFWLIAVACLFVIPVIIYFCSYIPYMLMHHTLWEAINMQSGMWHYHAQLRDPHPYYSEWYTWPFLTRPTWYYFHDNKNGTISGIIALGNPAIWWATVPAFFYTIWQAFKDRQSQLWYIGLAFFFMYVMWGISPRILNFSHYFLEAVPYACLCITYSVSQLWKSMIATKYAAVVYLLLVLGCFVFFYPLYSAYPIPQWYYNWHIWFRKWV